MKAKSRTKMSATQVVKDIRRATRKQYGAEEKIRIVLEGLRGESSIAELCRKEGIVHPLANRLCRFVRRCYGIGVGAHRVTP